MTMSDGYHHAPRQAQNRLKKYFWTLGPLVTTGLGNNYVLTCNVT